MTNRARKCKSSDTCADINTYRTGNSAICISYVYTPELAITDYPCHAIVSGLK